MPKSLIVVGADKGGVGKTHCSRAVLSYLQGKGVARRAFDTEVSAESLRRFHPDAQPVDLDRVLGQVRVLDTLSLDAVTVVDIRAGLLSPVLRSFERIGLFNDVREGRIRLVVLHVLADTLASLSEVGDTASTLADGGVHILVKNHMSPATSYDWDAIAERKIMERIDPAAVINLPYLDIEVCKAIEAKAMSFVDFANGPEAGSYVLQRWARHWLGQVTAAFDNAGVAELVRPKLPGA